MPLKHYRISQICWAQINLNPQVVDKLFKGLILFTPKAALPTGFFDKFFIQKYCFCFKNIIFLPQIIY